MKARKLKSGRWNVRPVMGKKDGRAVYGSITADTKQEALRLGAEAERLAGGSDLTVEEACRAFLKSRAGELSPSTLRGYQGTLDAYIVPDPLGAVRILNVSSRMLQDWVGRMDVSRKTKRNHLGFVLSVLRFFDVEKVFRVRIAPEPGKEMHTPTVAEVNAILDALDPETHLAACLACFGLRRGEICALEAEDVDRASCTVSITKALAKDPAGNWVLKFPKTRKSARVVSIPRSLVALLPEEGRIVPASPDVITNRFAKAVRRSGLPHFRFHDLRSFSASLALSPAVGAGRTTVLAIHGWETDKMLQKHYERPISDQQVKETAAILSFFDSKLHINP